MEAQSTYSTRPASRFARRLATETKQAFKTTEFWAYTAILIALFIAGAVTEGSTTTGTSAASGTSTATVSPDPLPASKVWLYATILTVGYLVARGLAKAGSRDPYWDAPNSADGGSVTDRVRNAAQALKEGDTTTQSEAGVRH